MPLPDRIRKSIEVIIAAVVTAAVIFILSKIFTRS